MLRIKKRARDTHKGDYGHLLVVAGSLRYTGAAYLCTEAAVLSGAGLVTLAMPKGIYPVLARKLTEAMALPLPETKESSLSDAAYSKIIAFSKKCSAVAIGPGLSQDKHTQVLIRRLVKDIRLPMVVDADGLNALAGNLNIFRTPNPEPRTFVITPHPGEMARLIGKSAAFIQNNKKTVARSFSRAYNVTTAIKGYKTVVASPDAKVYVNTTGNPGMAKGGCGDVLTGIISALLAQGMDAFTAARLGVYVHGLAGDIAAKEKSEISLKASDLLRYLPQAFKKVYG